MFKNNSFEPFKEKVWLAAHTMHGEEPQYTTEAYNTDRMSTVVENINDVERITAEKIGATDVGKDIFERGLCLPSDNKMTAADRDKGIAIIRACFA